MLHIFVEDNNLYVNQKRPYNFFSFLSERISKSHRRIKKKKKEKTNEALKYWISLICTGLSNFRYRISLSPSPPTRLQIRDSHHPLAENAKRTATNACLSRENNPLFGVEIEREPRDERRAIVTSHTLLEYASNGPPKAREITLRLLSYRQPLERDTLYRVLRMFGTTSENFRLERI